MREWYQKEHRNWVPIDGQRSKWWIWNQALDEARKSVRQIQTYLQRLSEGTVSDRCIGQLLPDLTKCVRMGFGGLHRNYYLARHLKNRFDAIQLPVNNKQTW